jgi:hypothetical protein
LATVIVSKRGVVAASLFGSSLSLRREQKAKTLHESRERELIKIKI